MTLGLTIIVLLRANLSLCGLPFLRGFYSKDLILEIILMGGINLIIMAAVLFSTFLTVAYSCRLGFLAGLNYIKSETIFLIGVCYYGGLSAKGRTIFVQKVCLSAP